MTSEFDYLQFRNGAAFNGSGSSHLIGGRRRVVSLQNPPTAPLSPQLASPGPIEAFELHSPAPPPLPHILKKGKKHGKKPMSQDLGRHGSTLHSADLVNALSAGSQELLNNADAERSIDWVLSGSTIVKSYPGTSQYQQKGPSACTLASLEAVRQVLYLEGNGMTGVNLLRHLTTRKAAQDISAVCQAWASTAHLEVDDIIGLPAYQTSLNLASAPEQKPANKPNFTQLLMTLRSTATDLYSSAVVITRPPETIAIFSIATGLPSPQPSHVFVCYDSHPRPLQHPDGAAFTFFAHLGAAAGYLSRLMSTDTTLLNDPSLDWTVNLLFQYSAHILVKAPPIPDADYPAILVGASLDILRGRSLLSDEKDRVRLLRDQCNQANATVAEQFGEIDQLRLELEVTKRALKQSEQHGIKLNKELGAERKSNDRNKRELERIHRSTPPDPVKWLHNPIGIPSIPGFDYAASLFSPWGSSKAPDVQTRSSGQKANPQPSQTPKVDNGPNKAGRKHKRKNHSQRNKEESHTSNRSNASVRDQETQSQFFSSLDTPPSSLPSGRAANDTSSISGLFPPPNTSVPPLDVFECSICWDWLPKHRSTKFDGCGHLFCGDCLKQRIESSLDLMNYPVACPVCVTQDLGTEGIVTMDIIKSSGVSEDVLQKWVTFGLQKYAVEIACEGCGRQSLVDRHDYMEAEILSCPWKTCTNMWCKTCGQQVESASPDDHSCDGSLELDRLSSASGWKPCPSCKTVIERVDGCFHMKCTVPGCNTHFCYTDGDFICQEQNNILIENHVNEHYSRCRLFEVPAEIE